MLRFHVRIKIDSQARNSVPLHVVHFGSLWGRLHASNVKSRAGCRFSLLAFVFCPDSTVRPKIGDLLCELIHDQ